MVTGSALVARYAGFAALSTAANVATQWLVFQTWTGPWQVGVAVLAGTVVGIPIKYVLDKRYIFGYRTDSIREDSKLFVLYVSMAVITTLIFWGTEWVFHLVFNSDPGRLAGAVLGLSIGYFLKFKLDSRFVFGGPQLGRAGL